MYQLPHTGFGAVLLTVVGLTMAALGAMGRFAFRKGRTPAA